MPYSGVYRVSHHNRHAAEHDVTCVSGRAFPLCHECGAGARFKLLQAVRLIDKHDLFRAGAAPRQPRPALSWWVGSVTSGEPEVV